MLILLTSFYIFLLILTSFNKNLLYLCSVKRERNKKDLLIILISIIMAIKFKESWTEADTKLAKKK